MDAVLVLVKMTHHICTGGCKGVSDTEGTCQAADCAKHEQPLTECNCEDDKHNGAFGN